MSGRKGPIKPVFNSPGQIELENLSSISTGSNWQKIDKLIEKHGLPDDFQRSLQEHKKEEHLKRLSNLRQELDHLNSTAWKYNQENIFK